MSVSPASSATLVVQSADTLIYASEPHITKRLRRSVVDAVLPNRSLNLFHLLFSRKQVCGG